MSRSPHRIKLYPNKNPLDDLPSEVFINEIVPQVPLHEIGYLCGTDTRLTTKCYDPYLWRTYIGNNQERLHTLLVTLAKQGEWNLFKYIWETDIGLIKELRTLNQSYVGAYLSGKKGTAHKIWNMKDWGFTPLYSERAHELMLDLAVATKKSDKKGFNEVYEEMIKTLPGEVVDRMMEQVTVEAHSSEFIIFIINVRIDELGLRSSNLNIARIVCYLMNEEKDFNDMLEHFDMDAVHKLSDTMPTVQIVNRYDPTQYTRRSWKGIRNLDPNMIDTNTTPKIFTAEELTEYAYKHPQRHQDIINFEYLLPAEQFTELYLNTAGCITEIELEANIRYWRFHGLDYLVSLFEKRVPLCEL